MADLGWTVPARAPGLGAFARFAGIAALVSLSGLLAVAGTACRARSDPAAKPPRQIVAWRKIGSWSGQGNAQTESFASDTGALRVRWEARAESPESAGTFRLTAHSAISGRLLQQVVDHKGLGSGVGYVQQDPHVFYAVVESDHLNWRFTVEEAISGNVSTASQR
jgi:hypothetical protein